MVKLRSFATRRTSRASCSGIVTLCRTDAVSLFAADLRDVGTP
jgi:hypothetical protein